MTGLFGHAVPALAGNRPCGRVAAVVVTHRRPAELRRLLESLESSSITLRGCAISDHAPDSTVREIAANRKFPITVLENPDNPGPGAGWTAAARAAREAFGELDAIWFLDDDVVIPERALETLWQEMEAAAAGAIAPLLEDEQGRLWGFPEPEAPELRRAIRASATPAEARSRIGDDPVPMCWCTGACFLVKNSVWREAGAHREDFWMLGEDLEFSMRVAAHTRAVFTCRVTVPHLPPPAAGESTARRADYLKFCSLLQNLAYLSFHSPHSRHMKFYLPGNIRRLFRTHGLHADTVRDGFTCLWNGAARGLPAGTVSGSQLRARITRRPLSR